MPRPLRRTLNNVNLAAVKTQDLVDDFADGFGADVTLSFLPGAAAFLKRLIWDCGKALLKAVMSRGEFNPDLSWIDSTKLPFKLHIEIKPEEDV